MQGFEVKFNVYANSQDEADAASLAIKRFISGLAERGVAVTANKVAEAAERWGGSYFVSSFFK